MPGDTLTREDLEAAIQRDPSIKSRLSDKGRALLDGKVQNLSRIAKPAVSRETAPKPTTDPTGFAAIGAPPSSGFSLSGMMPNKADVAESLPLAGMMGLPALGAALAPETMGGSLLATPLLGMLGGMGGGAWRDYFRGKSMTPSSVASDAATGASGEMAGPIVGKLAEKALPMLSPLLSRGAKAADFDEFGIQPSLGQATGKSSIAKIERIPPKFAIGGGTTAKLYEQQSQEARAAVGKIIDEISPTKLKIGGREMLVPPSQTGQLAKKNLRFEVERLRRLMGQPFEELSQEAGSLPVSTEASARAAERVAERNPLGAPSAAGKLGDRVSGSAVSETPEQIAYREQWGKPVEEFNTTQKALYDAVGKASRGEPVSFDQARALESQLGSMIGKKKNVIAGDRSVLMLRRLWASLRSDIDTFARSDAVSPNFASRLDTARNQYKAYHDFLDRGVTQAIKSDTRLFARNLFTKVDDPQVFSFIKDSMGPTAFGQAKAAWLADLVETATKEGRGFQPERFAEKLGAYVRSGKVDQMFAPQQADRLKRLVGVMSQLPGKLPEATGFLGTYEPIRIGLAILSLVRGMTAGVASSAAFVTAPKAISEITANPRIVNALTRGMTGKFNPQILRAAADFVAQENNPNSGTSEAPIRPAPKTSPLETGLLGTPPRARPTPTPSPAPQALPSFPPGTSTVSQAIDFLTRQ